MIFLEGQKETFLPPAHTRCVKQDNTETHTKKMLQVLQIIEWDKLLAMKISLLFHIHTPTNQSNH